MIALRHAAASTMLLGSIVALSGTAHAQPYASASLGYANAQLQLGEPYNGVIDDRSAMIGADFGFGFGERWALEAGFSRYGDFSGRATPCPAGEVCSQVVQPTDDNEMSIYRVAIVPRMNIGNVRMFARAGYYRAKIDTDIPLPNDDFTESGVILGAGLRWHFDEPWSVSLEATRFDDKVYQLNLGFGWGIGPLGDRD